MVSPDKSQSANNGFIPPYAADPTAKPASTAHKEGRKYTDAPQPEAKIPPSPAGSDKTANEKIPPLSEKNVKEKAPNNEAALRSYEISKKILGSKTLKELDTLIVQEHDKFDPTNIIAVIVHLADLKSKLPSRGRNLSAADATEISKILENLFKDLHARINTFTPEELAKVVHALAPFKDLIKPDETAKLSIGLFNQFKKPGFSIKSIATISESLTAIDPDNDPLFEVLSALANRTPMANATVGDLISLANSFCPRIPINKALISKLAALTVKLTHQFTPDNVAQLISAFDKARYCLFNEESSRVFEALAKSAVIHISFFSPAQLASTCRALTNFELDRVPVNSGNVSPGAAQQSFDLRIDFFGPVANALIQHKGIFSSRSLCDIAFSFAKLGINNAQLFAHLANKKLESQRGKAAAADTFSKDEIWRSLWAFATVGIAHKPLIDKLIARTTRILKDADSNSIGNILWSLAILDTRPDVKTAQTLVDTFARLNPKEISIRQAFAFYQQTTLPHPDGNYPLQWPSQLIAKFDALKIGDVNISKLQAEVYAEVKKMQPEAVEERPIRKMPVDIAIKKIVDGKKVKVAIEIDGPTHFAYKSRDPLGHTQFKRRLLNRKGWQVISVPYWDWDAIKPGDLQAKAAYLKSLLPSEALKTQPAKKVEPQMSKTAMKKARRAAAQAEDKTEAAPKPSKSAAKKARRAAAKAAEEAKKANEAESDDEGYVSFEESFESFESGEFGSAVPSAGESSESDDDGYLTADDK